MKRDDILRNLRNGIPLTDVKRKYYSQSQLYEALRLFSEEMEKRLNDARENLRNIQMKLFETNDEFQSIQSERTEVAVEVTKMRQEHKEISAEVVNMTK